MLPALKAGTLVVLLAAEWGFVEAATRGSLGPLFLAEIVAPIALLAGPAIYYALRMPAA